MGKYKNIGMYVQTFFGLMCAVIVLALLMQYVFSTRVTLHPLKRASGKATAPTSIVRDDSGNPLSEAEPISAGAIGASVKPVVQVPTATTEARSGVTVPILMYHHVGPLPTDADSMRKDLTVSPSNFVEQVQWLASHGYTSVTLQQVYLATQKQFTLPSKPVVFTFDDGYADVFAFAVPVLQKHGMVGSFAIVPSFLGTPDYGTWADVSMAKQLGMEIVSHTENHFDGASPKFDATYIQQNLQQSLQELETNLGPVPRILVYPYGHFTPQYIAVAEHVGFVMAVTTHFGTAINPDDLMHVPRVRVHGEETLEKFAEILTEKNKSFTHIP